MAINHRKLLSEPDSDQTTDCSNCDNTTCPYDCDYAQIYWPPEPPQLPPSSTTSHDSSTTHLSPYLIVIVAVIGSAILFISYYLIMIRYCTRFRRPSATGQVNQESQDFMDQDHRPEIDHPIWYITTIGLQPAVINSITVVKFKKGDRLIDGTDCSVCLSAFEDDESLRLLPKCNHAFHIPCIDTWLRSHTNCPLCRAPIFSNSISQPNDRNRNHGFGLNQITQMENAENDGDLGSNRVQEIQVLENRREIEDGSKEIQDSKTENETVITLRRSFSMDSAAEIVFMESNLSDGNSDQLQSSNHIRDSRTGRMMMRSFSYSHMVEDRSFNS